MTHTKLLLSFLMDQDEFYNGITIEKIVKKDDYTYQVYLTNTDFIISIPDTDCLKYYCIQKDNRIYRYVDDTWDLLCILR